jgi:hypothetical protein
MEVASRPSATSCSMTRSRRKRSSRCRGHPSPTFSRYFSAKPSRYSSGIPARRRPLIKVVSNKARIFGTP